MQRYFVKLCYKGTHYHGWQYQPNALSVQEVIEKAFSIILQEKIEVTGAGRTDTGVHASFYVLHFDSDNTSIEERLVAKMNSILPCDIAINSIHKVPDEAHARYSALSRTYRYFIHQNKNPFLADTSFYFRRNLDIARMNEASQVLYKISDFTSFSKLHSDVKTNFCRIFHAKWGQENEQIIFTVKADRFLRNMVRALVGTILEVGLGKITTEEFTQIIHKKNRSAAGVSVPAAGLFLTDIEYPDFGWQEK
jgi:tRNA pseudouridine38-40 synthase